MKLISLAFLLGLTSSVAYAKDEPFVTEKSVLCGPASDVADALVGPQYKEQPFWTGTDDTDRYVITVNKNANTWTIVQFNKGTACILGSGENHNLIALRPRS